MKKVPSVDWMSLVMLVLFWASVSVLAYVLSYYVLALLWSEPLSYRNPWVYGCAIVALGFGLAVRWSIRRI